MSNQYLKLRRSSVPGKVPTTSSLEFGEIALNTYDGLAFIKKSGSNGEEIVTIGGTASGSFTGSLFGTASWAQNSVTASFVTASNVWGPFGSNSIVSSSYALTSSFVATASWAQNALTASSADSFVVRQSITASNALITGTITAQTLNVQFITASTELVTGSTKFGTQLTNTHQFTGSVTITGSLGISGPITDVDYIQFNTSASSNTEPGKLVWNDNDGTLNLGMKGGNVTLQMGQEFLTRVHNLESTTLIDGQLVAFSGSVEDKIGVKLADATLGQDASNIIGMVTEQILPGEEGFVTYRGFVRDLNTTLYLPGEMLYLDTVPGAYNNTPADPPNASAAIGYAVIIDAVTGSIYVDIKPHLPLGGIDDVLDNTTSASYGDLLVKSGSVWTNSKQLTGSYALTGSISISGSLNATSSWAQNAVTASYVLNAVSSSFASTASFVQTAQTASFVTTAQTASFVTTAQTASFVTTAQTASFIATASWARNAITASFVTTAQTASFVTTAQTASFVTTAQTASFVTTAQTASFVATASWARNAITASFITTAQTASFVTTAQTASFVTTAQTASFVTTAQTASFVATASWAQNAVTASFITTAQTASFVTTAQTASFVATASWAQNARTASFITGSNVWGPFGSNSVISSSYSATASFATTASHVLGGASQVTVQDEGAGGFSAGTLNFVGAGVTVSNPGGGVATINIPGAGGTTFPYTGSAIISGSLIVTGSVSATQGGFTGSLLGTASWANNAITASFVTASNVWGPHGSNSVLTASYAFTSSYAINLIVSGGLTNVDYIDFDTASAATMQDARLKWDDGEGTLQLGLKGNVDANIGEQLYQYVHNAEATTLTKGTVVYVSGSQGGRIAVKRASATAEGLSAETLGLTAEDIISGTEGWVITDGSLRGVNTSGLIGGRLIFLSSSAGEYTQTYPQAPLHGVRLGYVQKVDPSPTGGIIYVKIDNGYELDELHDVKINGATSGDLLLRSASLWINTKQLTGSYTVTGSVALTDWLELTPGKDPGASNVSSSYLFVTTSADNTEFNLHYRNNGALWETHWLEERTETGIVWGGVLTFTSTTMSITPGAGLIINHNASTSSHGDTIATYVPFGPITASATFITSSQVTYLLIDENGQLVQQTTKFTPQQYNEKMPLGYIFCLTTSSISSYADARVTTYGQSEQGSEFIRAFGPLKLSGYDVTAQSGSLKVSIASGQSYRYGGFYSQNPDSPSIYDSTAVPTGSLVRVYRDPAVVGGFRAATNAGVPYTDIDPTKWDDGSGTLQTVASGEWTIQRIFQGVVNNVSYVYYGQNTYTSLTLALQSIATDPFEESPTSILALPFIGYVIAKGDATNLADTANNRIIQAGLFRNTAGSSGGGGAAAQSLDDLSDVTITSAINGQALVYSSGLWINGTPATASFAQTASFVALAQTASFVTTAQTASFVQTAQTASFVTLAQTASFVATASWARNAITASYVTGSIFTSTNPALSASYALTASYALSGGSGGSGLATKAGSIANTSFTGNPRKAIVTFSTPFANTSYGVVITGEDARTWTIEGKLTAGFTASANSNTGLAGTTYWIATAYGETT